MPEELFAAVVSVHHMLLFGESFPVSITVYFQHFSSKSYLRSTFFLGVSFSVELLPTYITV